MQSSKSVKIEILVDNIAEHPLKFEHGFSLGIDIDGKKILWDTGQGDVLEHNAKILDFDLAKIDYLVLSHGHYDHTGGLDYVLNDKTNYEIFLQSNSLVSRYSIKENDFAKYIGVSESHKEVLKNINPSKINWIDKPTKILEGLWLTGKIPRDSNFENTGGKFTLDKDAKKIDLIEDDIAMWIESDKGLIIICGCCHSGIVNTINYIKKVSGIEKIELIIGGLHLKNASENRLAKTIEFLEREDINRLVPCHCTGDGAMKKLQLNFSEICKIGEVGYKYIL